MRKGQIFAQHKRLLLPKSVYQKLHAKRPKSNPLENTKLLGNAIQNLCRLFLLAVRQVRQWMSLNSSYIASSESIESSSSVALSDLFSNSNTSSYAFFAASCFLA